MKILHRYIFSILVKNFAIGLAMFVFLFLMVDFFDRLDNVLSENASVWLIAQYFLCKVPLMVALMLPIAVMFSTLFTFGLLSKSSEITAMRASGLTLFWLARPLVISGLLLSVLSFLLGEFVVPHAERKQKQIYNLEIRKKDKRGGYSQEDFWWRNGNSFFAVDLFNSSSKSLHNFSQFELDSDWNAVKRTDAESVEWISDDLGWSMRGVTRYHFDTQPVSVEHFEQVPLVIGEQPEDFYEFKDDPSTMSYTEIRRFIKKQRRNGISTAQYLPDMYSKLAAPLVVFLVGVIVLPFTLIPTRTGSMAQSSLAALFIAFAYFAVDSFSISMGRADLLPAPLAAWMANIVMGTVALILNLGAEAPR
jgi:lipopolysaccharide export system permease protein